MKLRASRWVPLAISLLAAVLANAQQREGPSPSQVGTHDDGAPYQVPPIEAVRPKEPEPLRVERFEVHRLGERTQLGRAGDLVATFHGQGFQATARSPRLLLPDGSALDRVELSADGRRLFVVIPAKLQERIAAMRFDEVVIENPGSLPERPNARVRVKATPSALLEPDHDAPPAVIVWKDDGFVKVDAR